MILALVSDLIFESKVRGAAGHAGVAVRVFRRPADIENSIQEATGLVLDLTVESETTLEMIRRMRAERPALRLLGYLPHIEVELAQAAREAGLETIVARSKFSKQLPQLLRELVAPRSDA